METVGPKPLNRVIEKGAVKLRGSLLAKPVYPSKIGGCSMRFGSLAQEVSQLQLLQLPAVLSWPSILQF